MSVFNLVVLALLAISEVVALIPSVGSNSIFQLIQAILRRVAPAIRGLFVKEEKEEVKKPEVKKEAKK